jgi:hypothetical protein
MTFTLDRRAQFYSCARVWGGDAIETVLAKIGLTDASNA